ncbi:MAG: precorrin-8X methylmutase [Desulfobacteraceae bacterium]|nr:precorrin-8X methylmutase [Desulfobacteraceae bacterium]
MKPQAIEDQSFQIIDDEAGPHQFTPAQWRIVRRMIHTSADFDYMTSIRFHPRAIESGLSAIRSGNAVVTDTNMARAGIRTKELDHYHVRVNCLIADAVVSEIAEKSGTTRAKAAVDAAIAEMAGGIYVVGNAPTALLRLIEKIKEGRAAPALIVGLPVGFVNAAESKDALRELDTPFITNIGRKGGSNVAASVVNALAIMATQQPTTTQRES